MGKIIAIGGGELRERTTLQIDEYIASLAKARAGDRRANAYWHNWNIDGLLPLCRSILSDAASDRMQSLCGQHNPGGRKYPPAALPVWNVPAQ